LASASLIGGALAEVIAGINFYLYNQTSKQFGDFHLRLEKTQNFLLANSFCENMEGSAKQEIRGELVRLIANSSRLDT
jgi:neutral trehalase